ncbi:hypothetical protein [Microcoleus sp. FACHB-672]|uniref:hypothetical protein n=1 Tax=Microcoleus sp. FACHB-672 TaxID=2692825 RepID=UPI001686E0E3|nr:hypothetical protein [Microcoleus sp. FACHB-672]MBD2043909.1 hypothetical protein [Microcoleus sp. FACHB-672]
MREFRVLLLMVVFGGLGIFAWQNASPVLPVVFLGTQSLALPLSVLMLGAVAAGVLTSFGIAALYQLSNYLFERELLTSRHIPLPQIPRDYMPQTPREPVPPPPRRQPEPAPQANTVLQNNWGTSTASPAAGTSEEVVDRRAGVEERDDYDEPVNRRAGVEERDDYREPAEDDDEFYEDWEENERQADPRNDERDLGRDPTTYEVPQEPKTVSRYGSTYSIGYREPAESGVGKTESVYDADYRVINAPSGMPAPRQDEGSKKQNQEDDWDWDDDKRKPSKDW